MRVGLIKKAMLCGVVLVAGVIMLAGCAGGGFARTQWYSVHQGYDSSISFQDEKSWNGSIAGYGLSGAWTDDNGKIVLTGGSETMFMTSEKLNGQDALVLKDSKGKTSTFFKNRDDSVEYEKSEVVRLLASQTWFDEKQMFDEGELWLNFTEDGTWSAKSTKEIGGSSEKNYPLIVKDGASGKFTIASIEQTSALGTKYGTADYEGTIDFENVGTYAFSIVLNSSSSDGYDLLRIVPTDFKGTMDPRGMLSPRGVVS